MFFLYKPQKKVGESKIKFIGFLVVTVMLLCITLYITRLTIKNLIDFKQHYTKHKATIVDIEYVSIPKKKCNGYSAIYSYTDTLGNEYRLTSNISTSVKPTVGKVKEIYIDTSNPSTYYNSILDVLLPFILIFIITAGFIYATYCLYIETFC